MMTEPRERERFTFDVLDAFGDCTTLELLDTFRLEHDGAIRDYCVVRVAPGDDEATDDHAQLWPGERPAEPDEALQAFRLEPDGLATPEPGMESLLLGQAVLALEHTLARHAEAATDDALTAAGPE